MKRLPTPSLTPCTRPSWKLSVPRWWCCVCWTSDDSSMARSWRSRASSGSTCTVRSDEADNGWIQWSESSGFFSLSLSPRSRPCTHHFEQPANIVTYLFVNGEGGWLMMTFIVNDDKLVAYYGNVDIYHLHVPFMHHTDMQTLFVNDFRLSFFLSELWASRGVLNES